MFKLGRTFVHTTTSYIIHISALYDNATFKGMDVEDVCVDVDNFEVTFSLRKGTNLISVSVRPIGAYQTFEFHPIDFVMTEAEASKAYSNLQRFIDNLWEDCYEVFDQNPIEMEVYTHNKKVISEENQKVFDNYDYDNCQIGINGVYVDKLTLMKKPIGNIGFDNKETDNN